MASSTSHSSARGGWPRLTLRLTLVAVGVWVATAFYTLKLNPEIRHFVYSDRVKHRWAERMTAEHTNKVVVYGGSSCKFGIDGERLLERFRLPTVNLGRGAALGGVVLTMAALEEVRGGDTLIVSLEPGLITDGVAIPTMGIQVSVATGHLDWALRPLAPVEGASWADVAVALRPGGYHTITILGKLAGRQPLYRYRSEDVRPSGFAQTPVRREFGGPIRHGVILPEASRAFLKSLSEWCSVRGVRLAYTLPWCYTPETEVESFRKENIRFLLQVMDYMPVLKDPPLGAWSVRKHFADTEFHLDEAGSALRTDALGEQLIRWELWTRAELAAMMGGG